MTLKLYAWCALLFFLGQAATLFLYDIPENRKLAKTANYTWSWAEWWRKDWYTIIGIQFLGIIGFIILDEILHFRPTLINNIKGLFALFGIVASGIATRFGGYRKMVLDIIDRKTNIADNKTSPVISQMPESTTKTPSE